MRQTFDDLITTVSLALKSRAESLLAQAQIRAQSRAQIRAQLSCIAGSQVPFRPLPDIRLPPPLLHSSPWDNRTLPLGIMALCPMAYNVTGLWYDGMMMMSPVTLYHIIMSQDYGQG